MVVLSLLPVGLMQTWASVEHGYWYARSAEFLQTPVMNVPRWMRMPGDTLFALGALTLVLFVLRVGRGRSLRQAVAKAPSVGGAPAGARGATVLREGS
jgi:nitric oxide reductase subunit B